MDSYLYLFIRLLSAFFLCQDANKARSNCAIIGCNLSKKHKLTLHNTQNGEPNYVDHKFLVTMLLTTNEVFLNNLKTVNNTLYKGQRTHSVKVWQVS